MRSILILLSALLVTAASSAQTLQQHKTDSVFMMVKKYFNDRNADAIYNIAGDDFQRELSIDAFNDVANHQLFPLGQITESSLVSFLNNNLATYKVKLGANVLQVLISLDRRDHMETLLFQPYQPPVDNKTALVNTSNPLRSMMDLQVDTVVRDYIQKANTVGLCIGIIKNGNTTIYGYGETVKGNNKLPDADNFFEIGSITKTFTATLLAWYVDKGKLKLTDPIINFLPDSVTANPSLKGITIGMLANHTSGLPNIPTNLKDDMSDQLNPYKDYSKRDMLSYLRTCRLNSRPGEKYTYSNLAYGLLGNILEGVSQKPFEQMVVEVICKPLDMLSTNQYLNPLLSPRFVSVYDKDGHRTTSWDFDALASSGALRSTVNDLLKYARANMQPGKDSLSKAILLTQQVTFNKDLKIGLGWHVITVNNIAYYFHNGGTYGSNSFMAFDPKKNLAIVVLSNAYEPTDAVGTGILKKIQ